MFKYNLDQKVFFRVIGDHSESIKAGKITGAWLIKGNSPFPKNFSDTISYKIVTSNNESYYSPEDNIFSNLQDLVNVALHTEYWQSDK